MSEQGFKFDKNAAKRNDCEACKEDVPIFTNEKGERMHVDLFATPEFGATYDCPCATDSGDAVAEDHEKHPQ